MLQFRVCLYDCFMLCLCLFVLFNVVLFQWFFFFSREIKSSTILHSAIVFVCLVFFMCWRRFLFRSFFFPLFVIFFSFFFKNKGTCFLATLVDMRLKIPFTFAALVFSAISVLILDRCVFPINKQRT
jgi:hypothetical protein